MAESVRPGPDPLRGRRSGGAPPARRTSSRPSAWSSLDLDHLDRPPYVFEGSAAQVWACVDGDRTESEIVTDLAEAFEAPAEVVAADVRQFVDRLAILA